MVKEILYEESTRRLLQQSAVVKSINPVYKWLVAAVVIGIVSLIGLNIINDDSQERALIAYKYHDFPAIAKSRGAERNIVDEHIIEINQGKFQAILPLLDGKDLSEKDKFVKVLMLFREGEYDKSKQLISNTQWEDSYHRSELDWVVYLIAYITGEPLNDLESTLSTDHREKAKELSSQ